MVESTREIADKIENAKSPHGMTTFLQASSPHDSFTRFPWAISSSMVNVVLRHHNILIQMR
jgi:hypothetical protein